jgi:hypothetical protein
MTKRGEIVVFGVFWRRERARKMARRIQILENLCSEAYVALIMAITTNPERGPECFAEKLLSRLDDAASGRPVEGRDA